MRCYSLLLGRMLTVTANDPEQQWKCGNDCDPCERIGHFQFGFFSIRIWFEPLRTRIAVLDLCATHHSVGFRASPTLPSRSNASSWQGYDQGRSNAWLFEWGS